VNGRVVETAARAETGQMLVPVTAGMNQVEISLARTWDRAVGGWISLLTAMLGMIWILLPGLQLRTSDLGRQVQGLRSDVRGPISCDEF
jgi:hypothetical protein